MNNEDNQEELRVKLRRLEEAWFDAERKLHELQRFTNSGIWEHDWRNDKVWMSAELYRLFKIEASSELITNFGMNAFIHPDDLEIVRNTYYNAIKNKEIFKLTHRVILPTKELRYVEQTCETVYDHDGSPRLSVGVTQDITEKHIAFLNLSDSEFKFRDLLLKAPIPYQSLDHEGKFLFVNDALSDLLGYHYKQLIGNPFDSVWPDEEKSLFSYKFNELLDKGSIICELPLVHANGDIKQVVLAGRAIQNVESKQIQTHCMLFDITDRKKVEEQLLNTKSILENINEEENAIIQKQLNKLFEDLDHFEDSLFTQENAANWISLLRQCKADLRSASIVIHENEGRLPRKE